MYHIHKTIKKYLLSYLILCGLVGFSGTLQAAASAAQSNAQESYDYTLQNHADQVSPIQEEAYLDIEDIPAALTIILQAASKDHSDVPQLLAVVAEDVHNRQYYKYLFASNGLLADSTAQQKAHDLNYHLVKAPAGPVSWQVLSFLDQKPYLVVKELLLPYSAQLCLPCGHMAMHLFGKKLPVHKAGCQGQPFPTTAAPAAAITCFYSDRFTDQQQRLVISQIGDQAFPDPKKRITPPHTHDNGHHKLTSQQLTQALPADQLLIPANGQCLYTTIIMGYLLPVKEAADEVNARIDQLFGMQPAYYLNELHQTLENPTHYLTYLHSDAFSTLVTAFMARMKIKKGTWGGPQEIQTIATKLKINIQAHYPDPSTPTNLIQSDLTKPAEAVSDIILHIVRDRVHPAEVLSQAAKASAKDNPHYQHYRLKYTLPPSISVQISVAKKTAIVPNAQSAKSATNATGVKQAQNGSSDPIDVDYFWELVKKQLGEKPLPNLEDKDIVLLLGRSGVGKSTFINRMLGHEFGWEYTKIEEEKEGTSSASTDSGEDSDEDSDKDSDDEPSPKGEKKLVITKKNPNAPIAAVGNDVTSCTKVPRVYTLLPENLVLVDCPGFDDAGGTSQEILNLLMIRLLVQKAKSVKAIIGMIPYSTFTDGGRGAQFLYLAKQLDYLVEFEKCLPNIFWGITRYPEGTSRELVIEKIKDIETSKDKVLIEKFTSLWCQEILNTNQKISKEDEKILKDKVLLEELLKNEKNILLLSPFWKEKKIPKLKKLFIALKTSIDKACFTFQDSSLDLDVIGIMQGAVSKPDKVALVKKYKKHHTMLRTKTETLRKIVQNKAILNDKAQLDDYVANAVTNKERQLAQADQEWKDAVSEAKKLKGRVDQPTLYRTKRISLRARYLNQSKTIHYDDFRFDDGRLKEEYDQSTVKKRCRCKDLKPRDGLYKAEFTVAGSFSNWWHDHTTNANVKVKFYVKNEYVEKGLREQKNEEVVEKSSIKQEKEDDLKLAKEGAEAYLKNQTEKVLPQKIKDLDRDISKIVSDLEGKEIFVYFIGEVYPCLGLDKNNHLNLFAKEYKETFKLFAKAQPAMGNNEDDQKQDEANGKG